MFLGIIGYNRENIALLVIFNVVKFVKCLSEKKCLVDGELKVL